MRLYFSEIYIIFPVVRERYPVSKCNSEKGRRSMAILTIAREMGAIVSGEELILCNSLGLNCISKATLEQRFTDCGIERNFLLRFDECKPDIVGSITNSAGYYWETLRTIIMQELLQDNIAIFGRGGNFLLHDLVDFFSIRLIAPEDYRVHNISTANSISEAEALKMIRQSDSNREKFCSYYYGKSWSDPHNYDLVINTASVSMEELPQIIAPLLPDMMTDHRKQQLQLVIQTQIIKHTLFAVPELQLRYPDIFCDESGTVTLRGNVPSSAAARRAVEVVKQLPGVTAVNNELKVILNDIPSRLPPFMH